MGDESPTNPEAPMTTTAENHRKNTRVAVRDDAPELKLTLQFPSGGTDSRLVRAHDLSKTGMGFTDKAPIPLGTKCVLMLFHQRRPLRVIGKVTNCRADAQAGHVIGVKFISITPVQCDMPGVELTNDPAVDRLMIEL